MGEERNDLDGLDPAEVRLIRRYLLGRLDEAERENFEQRYFSEPGDLERLGVVEDELIEDYLKGDLDREERQRFLDYFLRAPRRRARLELIRQLFVESALRAAPRSSLPHWRWLVAAGLAGLGIWITVGRPARAPHPPYPEPPAASPTAPPLPGVDAGGLAEGGPLVTLVLRGGGVRGPSPLPSVRVPRSAGGLELVVAAPAGAGFETYRARVETIEGDAVVALGPVAGPPSPASPLRFVVPARQVRPGDYVLVLRGFASGGREEDLGSFPFRIER